MLKRKDSVYFVMVLLVVFTLYIGQAQATVPCEYEVDNDTRVLYHMNTGSGTTVYDANITNAYDGTLVGGDTPDWTTGLFGNGLQLHSGKNTYYGEYGAIDLPDGILGYNPANTTIEMYLNWDYLSSGPDPGDTGFLGWIFVNGGSTWLRGSIDTDNPARYKCRLTYGYQTYLGFLEISTPHEYSLSADMWTHVAIVRTWDGVNSEIFMYIDGELAASNSVASGWFGAGTSDSIGSRAIGAVTWGGQIDEFRMSNTVRDSFGCPACGDWGYHDSDINLDCSVDMLDLALLAEDWLKTGEEEVDTTSTSALYLLNQSSGTTVIDSNTSGRTAHDGTLGGTTLPTWTTEGLYDDGLHLARATDNHLQMGDLVHTSASFTLEFDFKWDYAYIAEPGYLFGVGGTAWARTNLLAHDPSPATARVTFGVRKGDGGWIEINGGDEYSLDTDWHHLAFVREWTGTVTNAYYYLDGQLAASATHNGGFWDDGSNLTLGHDHVNGISIGGTVDNVRFTKSALSEFGECYGQDRCDSDIVPDCIVNLPDYAVLGEDWQKCTDPNDPNCDNCGELLFEEYQVDPNTWALWHMNEGSGSSIADATGSYGMTNNGYLWWTGKFDDGLQSKSYPDVSYASAGPIPTGSGDPNVYQMSMSAWVQFAPPISPDGSYIISVDNPAFIRVSSGGTSVNVGFYNWDDFGNWLVAGFEPFGSSQVYTDTDWHHIGAVYDGRIDDSNNIHTYMYWDGVLVATATHDVNDISEYPDGTVGLVNTQSGMVYVGIAGSLDPNTAFYGSVDEVRISNTVRDSFFNSACD